MVLLEITFKVNQYYFGLLFTLLLTKNIFSIAFFILFSVLSFAQGAKDSTDIVSFADILYANEIGGMDILNTDTLYGFLEDKIDRYEQDIDYSKRYPKVYVTNRDGSEFLEIWGAPDIGFRQFYTIGYTKDKKCQYCGTKIGSLHFNEFYINNGIKLGDEIMSVWEKVRLNFFRRFKFRNIDYFYFERGSKQGVPFTPDQIFYYKFKDDKLIEIGFGKGFVGVNPMLQSE